MNDGVRIIIKTDIGFLNEKAPSSFRSQPVYVSLLVETSDGTKVNFARIR